MKKWLLFILLASTSMITSARDVIADYSVEEAMSIEKVSSTIGSGVRFFFADQTHPAVYEYLGKYQSNKKTNAFLKDDKEACQWVFASAMKKFHDITIELGGNAVINIRSNYKGNITSSNETFKCGTGTVISSVDFVADVVKLTAK